MKGSVAVEVEGGACGSGVWRRHSSWPRVAAWNAVALLGSVNDGQGVTVDRKRVRRQWWSFCGCEGGSREREMWLRLSESCKEDEGVTVVFWLVGGAVVEVFWLGGRFVCIRRCKGGRMNHDVVVFGEEE